MKFRISFVAAALVLAGCSADSDTENPGSSSSTGTEAVDPQETNEGEDPDEIWEPATVLETEFFETPLELSVFPVQSDGNIALVQFDIEIAGAATDNDDFDLTWVLTRDGAHPSEGAEDLRLIDRQENEVFHVAQDGNDDFAASSDRADMKLEADGGPNSIFAFFQAPSSATIDIDVPFLGYVTDVPVEEVASAQEFTVSPGDLDVGADISGEVFSLATRSVDFDEVANVQEEDDYVTWTLSSDVLFDFDEHELDNDANATLAEAMDEIQELALEDGEIHLVGHTDDQGSRSYNQELSEKRAASVQEVFADKFGSTYSITSEGKGMTEPIAEGTSEEARAANRRVEVLFTAKEGAQAAKRGAEDPPPETDAPTVTGHEQLEFSPGPDSVTDLAGISVVSVTELDDDYLLGEIEVEALHVERRSTTFGDLFADGGFRATLDRALAHRMQGNGTGLLTLATGVASLYPIEYVKGETELGTDRYDVVGDPRPMGTYEEGDVYRQHVLWPNPGSDTVTVEVPDRMRFSDVPVE